MKYVELKASLKTKIESAYLISGDDRYLCYDALKKIETALGLTIPDMNSVTISGESTTAREIVDSANVYPFGDMYRLVVVKNYPPTKAKKNGEVDSGKKSSKSASSEEFKIIEQYLKEPSKTTVLVFFNIENAEFFKAMSHITPVDCSKLEPKTISSFVVNYLAKNEISASKEAIDKLILYSLCDMAKITSELEKLSAYVFETKTLTADIVENFVVQDREFQVFELAEFLAKGDSENVFRLIDSFELDKSSSVYSMMTPLYNNYRRALFVSINKNKTPAELASALGVKEFAVKMLGRQIQVFSAKQLLAITQMISDYDKKLKLGKIKENIAIKMIATSILKTRGKNG